MIELTAGNILEADAQAIINTVNCVGVMGRGIALQFKKAFPDNFKAYKAACDRKELHPGAMFIFDRAILADRQRYIINFPTKRHWKGKSKLEDVKAGLKALTQELRDRQIHSVAIPPLGCGLGGLDWPTVRQMIEEAFAGLTDTKVVLYEPKGAPQAKDIIDRTRRPNMTPGRASLLGLMRRYLAGMMDVAVSLLELQKLMYFMQEAGEPLRLAYTKQRYGPYAKNLGNVLSHIEGHFVTGYGDGGDDPNKPIEPLGDATKEAEAFVNARPETRARFDRISDLIDGFETPSGMELLSTVHWVAAHDGARTVEDAIAKVHAWSARKRKIPVRHIRIAWDTLQKKEWICQGD